MAVIRERVFLRRSRKTEGKRLPHRIKLDKVCEGDSLVVEIFFSKKNNIWKCYRFRPELLAGRKSVAFSVSGSEVYWLRGLQPDIIDPADLPEDPKSALETKRRGRKPISRDVNESATKAERRVLVFDSGNYLDSIHRNLASASKATNILLGAIGKLCKKKRPSQETGLSFRYLLEKFSSDDRISTFRLTLAQYDEMCKKKPKDVIKGPPTI